MRRNCWQEGSAKDCGITQSAVEGGGGEKRRMRPEMWNKVYRWHVRRRNPRDRLASTAFAAFHPSSLSFGASIHCICTSQVIARRITSWQVYPKRRSHAVETRSRELSVSAVLMLAGELRDHLGFISRTRIAEMALLADSTRQRNDINVWNAGAARNDEEDRVTA